MLSTPPAAAAAASCPVPCVVECIDEQGRRFYRQVLQSLTAAGVPFLLGGAYAMQVHAGLARHTKDLDLFIRRGDYEQASEVLARSGLQAELTYPHWLGKVRGEAGGEAFIDLIFNSGSGVSPVDEEWFAHAVRADLLGVEVAVCPVEETIWSKAFVMERERYDGADVAHLLHARATHLDWDRLLRRFGGHWRVLLSHLVLFGFIYPAQRDAVPGWVMDGLLSRLRQEVPDGMRPGVCGGTLLSREQYLPDVHGEGLRDARVAPLGTMSCADVAQWTQAIPSREPQAPEAAARVGAEQSVAGEEDPGAAGDIAPPAGPRPVSAA